ncbi:hypothetical protein LAUMK4_05874 [Mycobacterium persicum]|uniref:Antitoxin Xre/MbcA/ParS-like toxin-binding domain-containing protein n=1 Tax=Mycobacterium persicum TaxID=1487726 RepID=A0ABY6RSK4_9MYCO|nr:hypothetical protein [Mycobacterium persicum]ORB93985.1 hypothetical protein B1T44_04950 [Mycobacterium persicum]VAZ77516.1 hypothetical protein LAUMK15_03879 [Mycobacterium persicum]VBA33102.1 hypothetical protein LAUMK4_05874 [Mycobacterium persicum]
MKLVGPGKQHIFDLAKQKMGDRVYQWLVTPQTQWEGTHDATPHGLLESGCPACLNAVLEAVEAMP